MNRLEKRRKAFELFEQGWSYESVAEEVAVEAALAQRWEEEFEAEETLAGIETEELTGILKDPRLSVFIRAQNKLAVLKEKEFDAYQQEKQDKELRAKRGALGGSKKLVNFLHEHCQGYKWKYEDVSLYIRKLRVQQTQIEEICGFDEEYFKDLLLWDRVNGLIDHLQELIEQNEEGETIKMNFDENEVLYLKEALEIEDFDEEVEEEIEEETSLSGLLEDEIKPSKY